MIEQAPQGGGRPILVLPFVLNLAGLALLMIVSLQAKGTAAEIGYSDYAPTVGALFYAIPATALQLFLLYRIWLKGRSDLVLQTPRYLLGSLVFAGELVLTIFYTLSVGQKDSYQYIDSQERIRAMFGSENAFLVTSLLFGVAAVVIPT
jgi:hypothetical protein